MEGMIRQVGNGKNIQIWDDNWIPHLPAGKLTPRHPTTTLYPLLVSELIDENTRTWNLQPIAIHIDRAVSDLIQLIPLGDGLDEDRVVWPWNKDGTYTAKSGYHWKHNHLLAGTESKSHFSYRVEEVVWG